MRQPCPRGLLHKLKFRLGRQSTHALRREVAKLLAVAGLVALSLAGLLTLGLSIARAETSCFVSVAGQSSQATLDAQKYGLGNEPYWLVRVPNSAIHAAADHGHLDIPISVVVNLSTVRSGSEGVPSGPCLSPYQEADDWDHDDRGAFGVGVTVDHRAGLRGIWTHNEPYGHDGADDALVRLNDQDALAKWGHLGKLLVGRGEYGSSGADAAEFVKDVSPNQSRVGTVNLTFRFPVTSEDSGVTFHVYDSERHKTWYAFSLDLLQKDRRYGPAGRDALQADDWHHVQRTNIVVVVDPDPNDVEFFRVGGHFDHSHDLTHDQFDVIVTAANNATDPETWLEAAEIWQDAIAEVGAWAADWAIEKLGLPHDVDLGCVDHPDVVVTEPDVGRFIKLIQGCAHDRGANKSAQLRVGNPSRVWVEVKAPSGGAAPESSWLLSGMLWPGAIENWEPTRAGQIVLRSELTTGAVIATVVGELIINALEPIISAAIGGYISSAEMRLMARAVIHYFRESVDRKFQVDLRDLSFSDVEGLFKAILDEGQHLLPEAINAAAAYAFDRLTSQVSEGTAKALLQGPLSKGSLHAALLKAEIALAVWRYAVSIGQLIGLATLDEQSRHAFGSVFFEIAESACPGCSVVDTDTTVERHDPTDRVIPVNQLDGGTADADPLASTDAVDVEPMAQRHSLRTETIYTGGGYRPSGVWTTEALPGAASGPHVFRQGAVVDLTAGIRSGYQFLRWEGALTGRENPTQITMDSDKTVRAVFRRIATQNAGVCSEESVVQPDHYCRYPGTNRVFSVAPSGGAQSPWSPELNRTGIKVDPYVDGQQHTFQAQELSDRSWRIEVIGAWGDLGECRVPLTVEPGQFCTRTGTTEQFRVYAVDELIPSDTRSLFPEGYAALYSVPSTVDDREVRIGNFLAMRSSGVDNMWVLSGDASPRENTEAIAIRFLQVSAGYQHTCALTEIGAVECWGSNEYGQSEAPGGRFSYVEAGRYHTCALTTNHELRCWGRTQGDVPEGKFSQFTVDDSGAGCGKRLRSGDLECWPGGTHTRPSGWELLPNTPHPDWADYPFAWYSHTVQNFYNVFGGSSCVLQGKCGPNYLRQPPAEAFAQLGVGPGTATCGITPDGFAACTSQKLRGSRNEVRKQSVMFTQVTTLQHMFKSTIACGLLTSNHVRCWHPGTTHVPNQWLPSPVGTFKQIHGNCGIREDGSLSCWSYVYQQPEYNGGLRLRQWTPIVAEPVLGEGGGRFIVDGTTSETKYTQVSSGWDHVDWDYISREHLGYDHALSRGCALTTDGSIECWGNNSHGQGLSPTLQFVNFSRPCGLTSDSNIKCIGDAVHSYSPLYCAVSLSGTLHCRSELHVERTSMTATATAGRFTQTVAHPWRRSGTCALTNLGTIECFRFAYRSEDPGCQALLAAGTVGTTVGCGPLESEEERWYVYYRQRWSNGDYALGYLGQFERLVELPPGSGNVCAVTLPPAMQCGPGSDAVVVSDTFPIAAMTLEHVSMRAGFLCAVDEAGRLGCWKSMQNVSGSREGLDWTSADWIQVKSPDGRFTQVELGELGDEYGSGEAVGCALTVGGEVQCWAFSESGNRWAKEVGLNGRYVSISNFCGLSDKGAVDCWGAQGGRSVISHHGRLVAIRLGLRKSQVRSVMDGTSTSAGMQGATCQQAARSVHGKGYVSGAVCFGEQVQQNGWTIELRPAWTDEQSEWASVGGGGTFRIPLPPAGEYRMRVGIEGCWVEVGDGVANGHGHSTPIEVGSSGSNGILVTIPEGLCELKVVGTIDGQAVGTAGDVEIGAYSYGGEYVWNGTANVEKDGSFSLRVPRAGSYVVVAYMGACNVFYGREGLGVDIGEAREVVVAGSSDTHIRFILGASVCPSPVVGQVVDGDRKPVSGLWVYMRKADSGRIAYSDYTGADGEFSLPVSVAGVYGLMLGGAQGCRTKDPVVSVVVGASGSDRYELRVPGDFCRFRIAGKVLNADGTPASGQRVGAASKAGYGGEETGTDGSFFFVVPGNGRYRLSLWTGTCWIDPVASDGSDGEDAVTRVRVSGSDVSGIKLWLPANPSSHCK